MTEFTGGVTPGFSADSSPDGIAAGPDGNLWFTERDGNRIGRITPAGTITEFSAGITAGSGPHGIAAGPDGNLWFAERIGDRIGRISPSAPNTIDQFATGITAGSRPRGIAAGADGNLWFTEEVGNRIGRITPSAPNTIDEFTTGITNPSGPFGIAAGPDGNLWFTEFNGDRIGRITPSAPNTITEFPTGITVGSGPFGIAAGPDGNLWFAESGGDRIGRISPSAPNTITEFAGGITAGSGPRGIAAGPDGNLWFAENAGARIGRINTALSPLRFSDPGRIAVPAAGNSGPAGPYPATIETEGLQGTVTSVTVRLNGVHHAFASDIEAQLVGPQGQSALLFANATNRQGDVGPTPPDVLDGEVISFAKGAATAPRRLTSGIFAPFDPGFLFSFDPPAPSTPTPNLSVFDGSAPNGVWKLFVQDDQDNAGTTGVIAGGWSLEIQTSGPAPVPVPGPTVQVPGPTIQAPADTTRPTFKLGKLASRTTQTAFRKGLRVQLTPSEPVTLDATLAAGLRKSTIAIAGFPLTLFERTSRLTAARRTLTVKPSRKLLGRPRRSFKARLRLVATDGAGNRTTLNRTITVKPDKKKR